jgi:wyosine [tRNA(Phe)-imidazoG37] synthetase (radical SAM superfamily)
MKPIAIVNTDYDDYLSIEYMVSNVCNYACEYCHPGSNEGDVKFVDDVDLLLVNFKHLLDVYQNDFGKKEVKLEITGGEPTLWPHLGKFTDSLKAHVNHINIAITTNGSRTLRWWRENSKSFTEIHLSLHSVEGDAKHMIEVADYLYNETECHVAVNVIMDPANWEQSMNNLNTMVNHPTPWLVKTWLLIDTVKDIRTDYTKEQLEFMSQKVHKQPPQEYIEKLIEKKIIPVKSKARVVYSDGTIDDYNSLEMRINKMYNFFGWRCRLGVDRVRIADGHFAGSCGARNLFNLKDPISIYEKDFCDKFTKDIIQPLICNQINCGGCTSDLKVPKAKVFKDV